MRVHPKQKDLCCKIDEDGRRALPVVEEKLHQYENASAPEHNPISCPLFRFQETLSLPDNGILPFQTLTVA